jgi:hypothetical protein
VVQKHRACLAVVQVVHRDFHLAQSKQRFHRNHPNRANIRIVLIRLDANHPQKWTLNQEIEFLY